MGRRSAPRQVQPQDPYNYIMERIQNLMSDEDFAPFVPDIFCEKCDWHYDSRLIAVKAWAACDRDPMTLRRWLIHFFRYGDSMASDEYEGALQEACKLMEEKKIKSFPDGEKNTLTLSRIAHVFPLSSAAVVISLDSLGRLRDKHLTGLFIQEDFNCLLHRPSVLAGIWPQTLVDKESWILDIFIFLCAIERYTTSRNLGQHMSVSDIKDYIDLSYAARTATEYQRVRLIGANKQIFLNVVKEMRLVVQDSYSRFKQNLDKELPALEGLHENEQFWKTLQEAIQNCPDSPALKFFPSPI